MSGYFVIKPPNLHFVKRYECMLYAAYLMAAKMFGRGFGCVELTQLVRI